MDWKTQGSFLCFLFLQYLRACLIPDHGHLPHDPLCCQSWTELKQMVTNGGKRIQHSRCKAIFSVQKDLICHNWLFSSQADVKFIFYKDVLECEMPESEYVFPNSCCQPPSGQPNGHQEHQAGSQWAGSWFVCRKSSVKWLNQRESHSFLFGFSEPVKLKDQMFLKGKFWTMNEVLSYFKKVSSLSVLDCLHQPWLLQWCQLCTSSLWMT